MIWIYEDNDMQKWSFDQKKADAHNSNANETRWTLLNPFLGSLVPLSKNLQIILQNDTFWT
jgi:hypothetical protein